MRKKLLAIIMAITMVCGTLIGCGSNSSKTESPEPAKTVDTTKDNTDKNKGAKDNETSKDSEDVQKVIPDTGNQNNNKTKEIPNSSKKSNSAASSRQQVIQVPVTIINGTDVDFAELYASGARVKNWGNDMLSSGITFGPGESIDARFNVDVNNLRWDLKAVDYNGDYLEFDGLDLSNCDSSGITIILRYNRVTGMGTITAE